jgi:hypothetical protein
MLATWHDRHGLEGAVRAFRQRPVLVPVDPDDAPVGFSAWDYAKERCQVLGAKPPLVFPADWEDVTAEYAGTVFSIVGVKPTK